MEKDGEVRNKLGSNSFNQRMVYVLKLKNQIMQTL